jgi:hypothetical protein
MMDKRCIIQPSLGPVAAATKLKAIVKELDVLFNLPGLPESYYDDLFHAMANTASAINSVQKVTR